MNNFRVIILLLLISLSGLAQQPTEATTYQNVPIGTQMIQAGYILQTTNTTIDGSVTFPNNNVDISANIGYLRYANFFKLGKVGAGLQLVLPFAGINADILGKQGSNSGFGDLVLGFGTNIFGSPPLTFPDFVKAKKKISMGWAIMITAPTGSYSTTKILNPSGHRWSFRPELGLTLPFRKWDFEAYMAIKFFTKNDKFPFLPNQPIKAITQKPFYSFTLHAVYNIFSKLWISADAGGRIGGETNSNNIPENNKQTAFGVGGTLSYAITSHHSLGVNYLSTAGGNEYAPNGAIFSIKYSYIFGKEMNNFIRKIKNANQQ